jgi:hypothetical protein
MSQANEQTTTRRAVFGLAAAASVAAVVPALASDGGVSPKLLELKRQLDEARAVAEASQEEFSKLEEPWYAISKSDRERFGREIEREGALDALKAAEKRIDGDRAAADEIERQIFAEPTTTREEFALKFAVASTGMLLDDLKYVDMLEDEYWRENIAARLLTDMAKLLGVAVA